MVPAGDWPSGLSINWERLLNGVRKLPGTYFKMIEVDDKETLEKKNIPTLKHYWVFNFDQTTITNSSLPEHDLVKAHTAKQLQDNFSDKPEVIRHPQPNYNPVTDKIGILQKIDFITEASYWPTLFHEGIHSTGAHKRIGRKEVMNRTVKFGDCDYSREELVAEL